MKKIFALVLALTMILVVVVASAQTVASGKGGEASITISNAAKGVKYTVTKIFDATYNTNTNTIAYTYNGTLPENNYFNQDATTGEITAKAAAKDGDNLTQAAAKWLKDNISGEVVANNVEDTDGNPLVITGLKYGYYLVSSDQGTGSVLSVSSTNPDATMKDKNTTEPEIHKFVADGTTENDEGETVTNWAKKTDANIGAPVEYKITAPTTNWHDKDDVSKQVIDYVINDNLAGGKMTLVSIDSVKVDGVDVFETLPTGFPITITWATKNADDTYTSLYRNGAVIEIIYKAKLADNATIDTVEANQNTADLNWHYPNDEPHFGKDEDHLKDSTKTETYGIAFVKLDKLGNKLDGAVFELPFKAKKVEGSDNTWIYDGEGTTSVTTTATGAIVVKGLEAGDYVITETEPPKGFNKLAEPVTITAQLISTSTSVTRTDKYWKYDENGNKYDEVTSKETYTTSWSNPDFAVTALPVLNLEGTLLPSTGGIGTTIFYILGGLLVVGAAVILVARRKAQD